MKKNKKAVFYSITVLMFIIFILIFGLIAVIKKTTHEKKIGEEEVKLIKKYIEGEKVLFYIDQAAKYSVYNATYSFAQRGAYFKKQEAPCGYHQTSNGIYMLWENIITNEVTQKNENLECYPVKKDIAINFGLFFNNILNKYFDLYPNISIPKDNYDFQLKENKDGIIINAIASRDVILSFNEEESKGKSVYYIKPSFKTILPYNFINAFTEYSTKTKEIRDKIKECLMIGSGKPDDDDLTTCADINRLRKNIQNIENYQINQRTGDKNYLLLFDIQEPSFKSPYSDGKLIVRFGIRFMDTFKPVATETVGIETKEENKYLVWKKNNASDVISYDIYIKKIEKGVEGIKTKKPTNINEMSKIKTIEEKTEWKIENLESGEYYAYVIANDKSGNAAQGTDIEPIEISI